MINQNWPRWIKASCYMYFTGIIAPTLPMFLEGSDRRTVGKQSYCELRFDGPYYKELSIDYWKIEVQLNTLVITIRNDSDIYQHERNIGLVTSAFSKGICIFKLGDTPDDNALETIGFIKLDPFGKEDVEISNFGQVQNDSRMMQSMIAANYIMTISL